jgi:hypothetical protein
LTCASSELGMTVCGLSGLVEVMNPSLRTKRSLLDPNSRVMDFMTASGMFDSLSPIFSRKLTSNWLLAIRGPSGRIAGTSRRGKSTEKQPSV